MQLEDHFFDAVVREFVVDIEASDEGGPLVGHLASYMPACGLGLGLGLGIGLSIDVGISLGLRLGLGHETSLSLSLGLGLSP